MATGLKSVMNEAATTALAAAETAGKKVEEQKTTTSKSARGIFAPIERAARRIKELQSEQGDNISIADTESDKDGVIVDDVSTLHFPENVFGKCNPHAFPEPTSKEDADEFNYQLAVREVISEQKINDLAKEHDMSTATIKRMLSEDKSKDDEKSSLLEGFVDTITAGYRNKKENIVENIVNSYENFMQGYTQYTANKDAFTNNPLSKMAANIYGKVETDAKQKVDAYINARVELYSVKDMLSEESYNTFVNNLIDNNSVIANSISNKYLQSEENAQCRKNFIDYIQSNGRVINMSDLPQEQQDSFRRAREIMDSHFSSREMAAEELVSGIERNDASQTEVEEASVEAN